MDASLKAALVVAFVVVVAGCTAQPRTPVLTYAQAMHQAQARFAAHAADGAKDLYKQAANLDPTQGEPWYQLAKINFDEQNYGRSIVDAQEVLQRDPANTDAQTILTVAGLRVAIQALGRLHDETNLEGPAHLEAQQLAAKMRDVLGQDVLVPPEAHRRERHSRRERHAVHVAEKATPPAKATTPPPANPFQALPGSGG